MRIIRTDIELFDLPQDAVIRTIGPSANVGVLNGERDEDAQAYQFNLAGERIYPRSIAWAGTEVLTYPHDTQELAEMLPAEVIYLPSSATEAAL